VSAAATTNAWSIAGSDGEPILGMTHEPVAPRGVILLAHGFKGYKDYGMFPRLATTMADAGLVAHRFNFSHSGMTEDVSTFARPELFERDTWNRQVHDLRALLAAIADGTIAGRGLPCFLFGHSRGGVAVLLTAGRMAGTPGAPEIAGIVTASAPSTCRSMSDEDAQRLLDEGFIESPSARTGQALRVGSAFLQEQIEDPEGHDLLALAGRITCPALVVHGADDPTVPVECAKQIGGAVPGAEVRIVDGADHVFNTPNPMPDDAAASAQLQQLLDAMRDFAERVTANPSPA
jgi:pimeloyl-ACP methyl ester carboxylesterase